MEYLFFSKVILILLNIRSHLRTCFSIFVIFVCFTSLPVIAKPGNIYYICNKSGLLINNEPNTDSFIVFRLKRGDQVKEIDSKGHWVEVGVIEKGHGETCCGFGWVLKEDLKRSSSGCEKE